MKNPMVMKCFFLFAFTSLYTNCEKGFSQQATNFDPSKSFFNINMPKTPESGGFEKYGYAQVNEFTGTSNISIPIYTLKSRFLSAPITLSYQARGIKVNQEASWVGLGFDLNVGGRITVETRGDVDFCSYTKSLETPNTQTTMSQIFARLGNSRENAVFTPASFWDPPAPCQGCPVDNNLYNGNGIIEMTMYGSGEPDIFRANFNEQSITFYIDKISKTIKFLGEKSNVSISFNQDSYSNIINWTLRDNDGILYSFNQVETTSNTWPASPIAPTSTTSAWLLSQITHPSGDYIQFTYNNYGYSVPAFTMNGMVDVQSSGGTIVTSDNQQNVNVQLPYYLTKIESADIAVDFILDTRNDLYGDGSRKLSQIRITDKLKNVLKRTVTFNYSYFTGTFNSGIRGYISGLSYNLPSPLSGSNYIQTSNARLRLDSLNLFDNSLQPAYKFFYNNAGGVPDKYSYSQDHWGYYNGVNNTGYGYSFSHLVPMYGQFGVQNQLPGSGYSLSPSLIGYSRDCDPSLIMAMTMDSIVYPTGGTSKLFYEPHQSNMISGQSVTGGGIRVKTMKNYANGNLIGTKEYSYSNGKYMGAIRYFTKETMMSYCNGDNPTSIVHWKYSANGAVNADEILIGYGTITIKETDINGVSNGSLVKAFNINTSSSNYSNGGLGYDLQAPYFVPSETQATVQGFTFETWLDAQNKNFPPTPSSNLEGKLMQEKYLDNSNNCLKSVNYYYSLGNYSNNFYDVKAIQNRVGGFSGSC